MYIDKLIEYLSRPQPRRLNQDEAAAYVVSTLVHGPTFGKELLDRTARQPFVLSDNVLYAAIDRLVEEKVVVVTQQRSGVVGRPRKMLHLRKGCEAKARKISLYWTRFTADLR